MPIPVITVENLSKTYQLGQINTGTFSRDLEVWWARVRGKPNPLLKIGQTDHGNRAGDTLWALKDVSFTVEQGEVLGIIGRNGAGKSTLLKILSRVTAPTSGKVKVKGRIASLLEVGTGFHPELTGRENIYLNGAILGMTKQEIARKFNEIIAFAEIEKFIDTPVKRYSSGMYVRLAFAVAAHLESEILLVDEVLAVGDAEFQKKCLGKIGDVASREGRTVLFVSHNMASINNLCRKSLLLSKGQITDQGSTPEIISKYLTDNEDKETERIWDEINNAPGNHVARLHAVRLLSNGKKSIQINSNQEVILEIEYWNLLQGARLVVEVRLIDTSSGYVLEAFNTPEASMGKDLLSGKPQDMGLYKARLRIPPNFLNNGHFRFQVMVVRLNPATAEINLPEAIGFYIIDTPDLRTAGLSGKWLGSIRTTFEWKTEFVHGIKDK